MKRSKFTDSQIMDAVKRVEAGIGVPDSPLANQQQRLYFRKSMEN